MQEKYRVLFEPGRIAGVPLKNRFYMAPIGPSGMCDAEGAFTETAVEYYAVRARGGVGLIITGDCFVENEIQPCVMPSHVVPTLRPTCFIRSAKRLTERVHAYGTKIFIQLSAGFGRVGHASNVSGDVIAPSPVEHRWIKGLMCREMTVEEIHTFVRKFGEAAAHAKKAGFDGVEIHAIHEGYLLDQFTLALFNKRTDAYGGSLENRLRFAVEIVQEIKRVCGADFPVGVRYSPKSFVRDMNEKAGGLPGQEFEELGRDMDEGLTVAKMLQDAGYDFLDADVGSYESWHWSHPPMYHQKGMYLPYVSQLKKVVEIPVMCAGRMDNPDISSAALAGGKDRLCGSCPSPSGRSRLCGEAAPEPTGTHPTVPVLPGGMYGAAPEVQQRLLRRQSCGGPGGGLCRRQGAGAEKGAGGGRAAWPAVRPPGLRPSGARCHPPGGRRATGGKPHPRRDARL